MSTFQFNCKGVPLNQYEAATNETIPQAWWTGERGEIHFYWHSDGGDDPLADGCACYPVSDAHGICHDIGLFQAFFLDACLEVKGG